MARVILDGYVSNFLELDQPGYNLVRLVSQIDHSTSKLKLPPIPQADLSFRLNCAKQVINLQV
jgi:hypothetical protein